MKKTNGTILVIAQDKRTTFLLVNLLSERFDLITAASGEGGLRRFYQVRDIDLIFLEHELSDMDGLSVLHSIRKSNRETPVAFITGNQTTRLTSEAVEYGINAYLQKPLDEVDVERAIPRICAVLPMRKPDVERAKDFIEEHFTEQITAGNVVATCRVGYRQLARSFKDRYGCTIMEYVKRLRVEKSKKLLQARCVWIYDIAHLVGFSNSKTFCATFKRMNGMTPKQYQEEVARSAVSPQSSQIVLPFPP